MTSPYDADAILSRTFVRQVELHAELSASNDRALEMVQRADVSLPLLRPDHLVVTVSSALVALPRSSSLPLAQAVVSSASRIS